MAYTKIYTRVNWKNESESKSTPLGATNLNRMDDSLDKIDNRIIEMDNLKLDRAIANSMIKDWHVDEKTGVVTITKLDGSRVIFDLNLEKVPVDFELTPDGILIMRTDDNMEFTADIGALIPTFIFNNSDTISAHRVNTNNGSEISFEVKDGSITGNKLQPDYLANMMSLTAQAEQTATNLINQGQQMARQMMQDTQQTANALIANMEQTVDGITDSAQEAAEEAQKHMIQAQQQTEQAATYAAKASVNAERSNLKASQAARSATRAGQLVEEAYKIIENSSNGFNDILKINNGFKEEVWMQPQAEGDEIIGIEYIPANTDVADKDSYYVLVNNVSGISDCYMSEDGIQWQRSHSEDLVDIYGDSISINRWNCMALSSHGLGVVIGGETAEGMGIIIDNIAYPGLVGSFFYPEIEAANASELPDSVGAIVAIASDTELKRTVFVSTTGMIFKAGSDTVGISGANTFYVGQIEQSNTGNIKIIRAGGHWLISNGGGKFWHSQTGENGTWVETRLNDPLDVENISYINGKYMAFSYGDIHSTTDFSAWEMYVSQAYAPRDPQKLISVDGDGRGIYALSESGNLWLSDESGTSWNLIKQYGGAVCLGLAHDKLLIGNNDGSITRRYEDIDTLSLTETVKLLYLDYLARQNG